MTDKDLRQKNVIKLFLKKIPKVMAKHKMEHEFDAFLYIFEKMKKNAPECQRTSIFLDDAKTLAGKILYSFSKDKIPEVTSECQKSQTPLASDEVKVNSGEEEVKDQEDNTELHSSSLFFGSKEVDVPGYGKLPQFPSDNVQWKRNAWMKMIFDASVKKTFEVDAKFVLTKSLMRDAFIHNLNDLALKLNYPGSGKLRIKGITRLLNRWEKNYKNN